MSSYLMDPQSTLDWVIDFSSWLTSGETINGATVTVPAGITLAPAGRTTEVFPTKVVFWLSGGTDGITYPITCSITTTAGRADDRTIRVRVMQR